MKKKLTVLVVLFAMFVLGCNGGQEKSRFTGKAAGDQKSIVNLSYSKTGDIDFTGKHAEFTIYRLNSPDYRNYETLSKIDLVITDKISLPLPSGHLKINVCVAEEDCPYANEVTIVAQTFPPIKNCYCPGFTDDFYLLPGVDNNVGLKMLTPAMENEVNLEITEEKVPVISVAPQETPGYPSRALRDVADIDIFSFVVAHNIDRPVVLDTLILEVNKPGDALVIQSCYLEYWNNAELAYQKLSADTLPVNSILTLYPNGVTIEPNEPLELQVNCTMNWWIYWGTTLGDTISATLTGLGINYLGSYSLGGLPLQDYTRKIYR